MFSPPAIVAVVIRRAGVRLEDGSEIGAPRVILAQSLRFMDLDTPGVIAGFENFSGSLQAMHEWLAPEVRPSEPQESSGFMQRA